MSAKDRTVDCRLINTFNSFGRKYNYLSLCYMFAYVGVHFIFTTEPCCILRNSSAISSLAILMQPCDAGVPSKSSRLVPCI